MMLLLDQLKELKRNVYVVEMKWNSLFMKIGIFVTEVFNKANDGMTVEEVKEKIRRIIEE